MEMKTRWKQQNYRFHMSKRNCFFIMLMIYLAGTARADAQNLNFGLMSSNNYAAVNTYSGITSSNAFALRFQYTGAYLNVPNWKITVKLGGAILSTDGLKTFPANKINLKIVNTGGQAQPNPVPTVTQIGVAGNVPLSENQELFLVPQAQAPLYNVSAYNSYFELQLYMDMTVLGGSYLSELQGGDQQKSYNLPLEFKAYGPGGEVLGAATHTYRLDIFKLNGAPPADQLRIQVNGGAVNGLLDHSSLADYINGASVTYNNSLSVTSTVDYEVKVKALNAAFTSETGKTLPLNIVHLLLSASGNNSSINTFPVQLSQVAQKIATGTSTLNTPVLYDIKYYTAPNTTVLTEVSSGAYKAIIQYEIIPR